MSARRTVSLIRGGCIAFIGAIVVSFLGHWVFFGLVVAGAPCLNTLHPGPSPTWVCHAARFGFYLVLASAIVWLWRSLSGGSAGAVVNISAALLVAAVVWTYWYILDPSLMLMAAGGTRLGTWWMEHTYGRPILGEVYWGWGFARYQWWFVAGQGVLAALTLLAVSWASTRRIVE
jgi:hypothetical protein